MSTIATMCIKAGGPGSVTGGVTGGVTSGVMGGVTVAAGVGATQISTKLEHSVSMVSVDKFAVVVRSSPGQTLTIDSRSFLEHNTSHILHSVNVCCSKLVKRRLQQDKLTIKDLLAQNCHVDVEDSYNVLVYDQQTSDMSQIPADSFLFILLRKLANANFKSVSLLEGGFLEFQANYPALCESRGSRCTPLTSLSQPCLPVSNVGPTRILPWVFLGSQHDALAKDVVRTNGITHVLNISASCTRPDFVNDGHFKRIPVNDNYSEKLIPWFDEAFQFMDKVREGNGCVLIHCLAGISRSPTMAIAYVMRHLHMTSDDAYRYVKEKRPSISPNFNFLGQLLEFEQSLRADAVLCQQTAPAVPSPDSATMFLQRSMSCVTTAQSPTTALANLSFSSPTRDVPHQVPHQVPHHVPQQVTQQVAHHVTQQGTQHHEVTQHSQQVPLRAIPTSSLDKLNFTPCIAGGRGPTETLFTDTRLSHQTASHQAASHQTTSRQSTRQSSYQSTTSATHLRRGLAFGGDTDRCPVSVPVRQTQGHGQGHGHVQGHVQTKPLAELNLSRQPHHGLSPHGLSPHAAPPPPKFLSTKTLYVHGDLPLPRKSSSSPIARTLR